MQGTYERALRHGGKPPAPVQRRAACPPTGGAQPLYLGEVERTTRHSAQYTRQLMVVLDSVGIATDGPLTASDLAGVPLPQQAWDGD